MQSHANSSSTKDGHSSHATVTVFVTMWPSPFDLRVNESRATAVEHMCLVLIPQAVFLLECTQHNHFMAFWNLSGTTRVSRHQKVHFAIFWIFWSKMKLTQADAPTIWMDYHPIQTNWCPHLCHPHHFYAGCPSLHNPPNLSWLRTGTKHAGLHTWWLLEHGHINIHSSHWWPDPRLG